MEYPKYTGYGESSYYNVAQTDTLDSDLEHWTTELVKFNNEHPDSLPSDWLDTNNPMSSFPGHLHNIQEVAPLGNGTGTVSPEAIAHTSNTLSALPHPQTHYTALDKQVQAYPYNIDPNVLGGLTAHTNRPEQHVSSPSSGLMSYGQTHQSSSSSEEVRILKQEVARLQQELFNTQQALRTEQEARQQLEAASNTRNKPGPKPKANVPLKEGEPKNARTANIENFNADDYYEPNQVVPAEWVGPATGRTFTYTAEGELDPEAKFSPGELEDFLVNHPHNHPLLGSRPILWIGNVPADAGKRYPTKDSAACRFQECPIANNTIKKGSYRVTIDEWGYNPEWMNKDPYHNAGYVHLYCLEKFMDLPGLYRHGVAVFADCREFKEGRNKMAITRDYPSMKEIVEDYLKHAPSLGDRAPGLDGWYKNSLSLRLTEEHLRKQPATRQSVRGIRGGNSIDVHKNNLDELVANQQARRPRQPREPNAPKRKYTRRATASGRKRKTSDAFEDDSDEDEAFEIGSSILERASTTSTRETRAAKKLKSAAQPSWEVNGANGALDTTFRRRAVRDWMDKK